MSVTYNYFYTVDAYVHWTDALTSDNIIAGHLFIEGEFDPALYPEWILVHKESTDNTASKWTIQKDYTVKWRLRFYCEKVEGGTKTLYWLSNDVVKNVHVTFPTSAKLANNSPGIQTIGGKTSLTVSNPSSTGDDVFTFWTHPTQTNFQFGDMTVTANIDLGDNYSKYGGDPDASIKHPTKRGVYPQFVVYNAKPIPPLPAVFRDALDEKFAGNTIPIGATPYAFDRCANRWYGISITSTYLDAKTKSKVGYKYRVITCEPNGTKLSKGTAVSEDMPNNTLTGREGKNLIAERQKLQTIILANCSKNVGGSGGAGDGKNTKPPKPTALDALRWNPPPHVNSRGLSYGEVMETLQAATGTAPDPESWAAVAAQLSAANLERGRILQDSLGASVLNKNTDKLKLPAGDRWGFRFMYNPNSFSYGTASNNSVDWTLGSKDPSILMNGNSNVSFELYINRIADMSYLKDYKSDRDSGTANYLDVMPVVYGRYLEDEEINGILNRGTEYDIEFLYRVLNGDPIKKSLLFNSQYDGWTSDFGYTTATPCWLYLNENLRYFGSVMNFTVNHAMFDLNMVPILSTVTIQFSRIPALFDSNDSATQKKAQAELQKFIGGTPTA